MNATAEQRVAYEQSAATAEDACRCLLAAFAYLGIPESMMDVGCGPGHLVKLATMLGSRTAFGVDINVGDGFHRDENHSVVSCDLIQGDVVGGTYDLALCLEVAEHLPPESSDTLCDTLAQATGGTLLFSAATPGQGGSGHLHEMPHEYWREKLVARGLRFDPETTEKLRRTWGEVAPAAWWYGKNIQVFRQTDREGRG